MAYKLSQRHEQDKISSENNDPNRVDRRKIATVLIVFGLLSLFTSWIYGMDIEDVVSTSFHPGGAAAEVGPLTVKKHNAAYVIRIRADMTVQTWSFIEGQVLDSNKEFLFSFGKELWHEQGRDGDGVWREADDDYAIDVTFPQPGTYYVRFHTESNREPSTVFVAISQKCGSGLPHLWFGVITLGIGILLNERGNRTVTNVFHKVRS